MKTQSQILKLLHQNKQILFNKYPIKELALFGSFARNEQNVSSDIDILVEFNKNVGIEFIELADELEDLIKLKVDLVSKNGIKDNYFQFIKNDLKYV
jgi:hypothetical protein